MSEARSSKQRRYSVDTRSYDLAKYFLGDDREERIYEDLAQQVQDCVEDFCRALENAELKTLEVRARLVEISGDADVRDFMLMRNAQRNPRVCCSNWMAGEPIHYGGRRQL